MATNQYDNNAVGKLLADLAVGGTSLTLQSGQGSNFPTADGTTTQFKITLVKSTGEREICVCSRTAGSDVISFIGGVSGRGQEGTSALAFSAGDQVELRLTAAQIQSFEDDIDTLQTTVSGISADYLDSAHLPGGADEDDHDARYYTQAQSYTKTELDAAGTGRPNYNETWTRAQLAASGGGAPIDAEHLTGKDAITHSQITDNEATKHRLINDSAGNGATTSLWSADKIYDQLALKSATSHTHDKASMTVCQLHNLYQYVPEPTMAKLLKYDTWFQNYSLSSIGSPIGTNESFSTSDPAFRPQVVFLDSSQDNCASAVRIGVLERNAQWRWALYNMPGVGSGVGSTEDVGVSQTAGTSTYYQTKTDSNDPCIQSGGFFLFGVQGLTTDNTPGRYGILNGYGLFFPDSIS